MNAVTDLAFTRLRHWHSNLPVMQANHSGQLDAPPARPLAEPDDEAFGGLAKTTRQRQEPQDCHKGHGEQQSARRCPLSKPVTEQFNPADVGTLVIHRESRRSRATVRRCFGSLA